LADKIADAAANPTVTAPKEPRPEQQRRGRFFVTVYASILLVATVGFVALAVFVNQQDVITNFDAPVAQAIQSINLPVVSWILVHMSDLGWAPLDVICVVAIAIVLFLLRLRLEAVLVVVSTLLAGEVGTLTKGVVQRARPTASFVHLAGHLADFSFPSGHVIFATVLFGTTFAIVWIVWARSLLRNAVLLVLAALVLLMGPSRIYLGEHWPTDVIGAYCLGGLWLAGTVELMLALRARVPAWWQGREFRQGWRPLI
jgi:undecaprenyl-diphosphatase